MNLEHIPQRFEAVHGVKLVQRRELRVDDGGDDLVYVDGFDDGAPLACTEVWKAARSKKPKVNFSTSFFS